MTPAILIMCFLKKFFFCPRHHFPRLLKHGHINFLPCFLVSYQNGCPNQAKCPCWLGPGGQVVKSKKTSLGQQILHHSFANTAFLERFRVK